MSLPAFTALIYSVCGVAGLAGVLIFLRMKGRPLLDRLIAALLPLAGVAVGMVLLGKILYAPAWDYNNYRLLPSFALKHGCPIYGGEHDGPVTAWWYGPVPAFAYLPATLSKMPTGAIQTGVLISMLLFFGPVAGLLFQGTQRSNLHLSLGALVCFGVLMGTSIALTYSAFTVHADAPALGLSAAACVPLLYRRRPESWPALVASALLAVLAVWSKQNFAPVPVVLCLYVLLADGRRCFLRYVTCLAAVGLVISVAFLSLFGVRNMIFDMFVVNSSSGWSGTAWPATKDFVLDGAWSIGLAILLLLTRWLVDGHASFAGSLVGTARRAVRLFATTRRAGLARPADQGAPRVERLRQWLRRNNWTMPMLVGLVMAPVGVLFYMHGGDVNSFSPGIYFIAIAACMLLVQWACDETRWNGRVAQAAKTLILIGVAAVAILKLPRMETRAQTAKREQQKTFMSYAVDSSPIDLVWRLFHDSLQHKTDDFVFNRLCSHPNTFYFPDCPLAHLMAEGKLYHATQGILWRCRANLDLNDEHFRRHIPQHFEIVAVGESPLGNKAERWVLEYLPEFTNETHVGGWVLYSKRPLGPVTQPQSGKIPPFRVH